MVNRYDIEQPEEANAIMVEVHNGDYVEAGDYDELAEENKRLKAIIEEAIDLLRGV